MKPVEGKKTRLVYVERKGIAVPLDRRPAWIGRAADWWEDYDWGEVEA